MIRSENDLSILPPAPFFRIRIRADKNEKGAKMDSLNISTNTFSDSDTIPPLAHGEVGGRSGRASTPVVTSSNQLLKALPKPLFEALRPSLRTVFLRRDQLLYLQDDRLDYVYFPETAVISELRTLEDGRTIEVALEGNEGAVGLSAMFCESRVANCTQVAQGGSAVRIESEVLERMMRVHPELAHMLLPQMDTYIRQISQRSICNVYHSVKERLCMWLLLLQERSGRKTLKLTHEQIARALGVYRPSITCVALELKKDKLINYSRGGVSIRDRRGVESHACGCYHELAMAM
jgi:CRP-like cAMP-binding protein